MCMCRIVIIVCFAASAKYLVEMDLLKFANFDFSESVFGLLSLDRASTRFA